MRASSRTVEINYTFYRMPTREDRSTGWRGAGAAETFRFTLKAPKRITHDKRLRAADVTESLQGVPGGGFGELGPQLRCVVVPAAAQFQEGPVVLLERVSLALLPPKTKAAFEFRNASWLDDEVFAALRGAQHRAVYRRQRRRAETPIDQPPPITPTCACVTRATAHAEIAQWTETAKTTGCATACRRVRVFQARRRGQGRGVRTTNDDSQLLAHAQMKTTWQFVLLAVGGSSSLCACAPSVPPSRNPPHPPKSTSSEL